MAGLAHRLTLPLIVFIFVVLFQISISDLSFESRALPQIAIIILGLVCLYSVVRDLLLWRQGRSTEQGPVLAPDRATLARTVGIMVVTAGYILLLEPIGFYPATALFLGLAYTLIGGASLWVVPYVAASLAIVYVFFELGLTVLLPGSF